MSDRDSRTASRIPGFYRMTLPERQAALSGVTTCSPAELAAFYGSADGGLPFDTADRMVENCVGVHSLPLGVGVNLRLDGEDRLVPMAVEEPSVIAALSHGAKLLRAGDGVVTSASAPVMIGQIQLLDVPDLRVASRRVLVHRKVLLERANALDPVLVEVGGGARDVEVRVLEPQSLEDPLGPMLVVHLLVDVRDAMGANAVNTMAEALAPALERLTGGRARLRILSNLADRRVVTARGHVAFEALGRGDPERGRAVAAGIQEASVFAERDPYRAATHDKGIMNGVDAVLVATGQDWRAVEAGAHAYAARDGRYTSLSRWRLTGDGLVGELSLPMAVGTVGGIQHTHPGVRVAVRQILAASDARTLGRVAAACGLAQNLAALRALATEGIQRGHMTLHARNVAVAAGARGDEVDALARILAADHAFDAASARAALLLLRQQAPTGTG